MEKERGRDWEVKEKEKDEKRIEDYLWCIVCVMGGSLHG
jgi:hypothetical protein